MQEAKEQEAKEMVKLVTLIFPYPLKTYRIALNSFPNQTIKHSPTRPKKETETPLNPL